MIVSVYFILIVLAILLATVFSAFSDLTKNPYITFFIIAFGFSVFFFLVHGISKYFEYDSDGLKVVVMNRGLLFGDQVNYREHKAEFDKEELLGYKFNNYVIYKTLTLLLKDHRGHSKKERFNVTLVAKKKRRYIRQSLSKIVKNNRKQKVHD